jgi:hypothetical protein
MKPKFPRKRKKVFRVDENVLNPLPLKFDPGRFDRNTYPFHGEKLFKNSTSIFTAWHT